MPEINGFSLSIESHCFAVYLSKNSTPEKITNNWRIERDGIAATKFAAARIQFLSDVWVAALSLSLKLLNLPFLRRGSGNQVPWDIVVQWPHPTEDRTAEYQIWLHVEYL